MPWPAPITSQPHYGRHLGDVDYWSAYVNEVLDRHGLPRAAIEPPVVGTFPTFLVGEVVVKLFADTFDGARSFAAEKAIGELLDPVAQVPVPRLIASGQLFDDGDWMWPYLVTERLFAAPIREAPKGPAIRSAVEQLGRALAHLHALPAPHAITSRDPLPRLRAEAASRQRQFGLPAHLAEQIPDFLSNASDERVLVHADLTADHLFIGTHGLAGIIDWGDAITADPWYELVALRFDALHADPRLFQVLLDSYGWRIDDSFPTRAMQGVLEFQFDAIGAIRSSVDLARVATLRELAERLFGQ
jgi:hygromycin-B 7''-O-kinase